MTTNKQDVQRYVDMGTGQICPVNNMRESDDGNYVLYEDYKALQAENDRLRAKLAAMESELSSLPAKWIEDSSLETWFPLTSDELESLREEVSELRAYKEAAEGQKPSHVIDWEYDDDPDDADARGDLVIHQLNGMEYQRGTKLYARPIPPQKADKPAARITEQDAREIALSVLLSSGFVNGRDYIDPWLNREGRALLNKLNADRQVPAVAMPDGWKLVPKIPTTEMLMACAEAAPTLGARTSPDSTWTQWAPNVRWKAMVDAAPIAEQSPRITEQDARELLVSFTFFRLEGHAMAPLDVVEKYLGDNSCKEMLSLLNNDRCPSHDSEQGGDQ